jgi:hypothetical protein
VLRTILGDVGWTAYKQFNNGVCITHVPWILKILLCMYVNSVIKLKLRHFIVQRGHGLPVCFHGMAETHTLTRCTLHNVVNDFSSNVI